MLAYRWLVHRVQKVFIATETVVNYQHISFTKGPSLRDVYGNIKKVAKVIALHISRTMLTRMICSQEIPATRAKKVKEASKESVGKMASQAQLDIQVNKYIQWKKCILFVSISYYILTKAIIITNKISHQYPKKARKAISDPQVLQGYQAIRAKKETVDQKVLKVCKTMNQKTRFS